MTVWFDLSLVQANDQSVLLAAGQKVLCAQILVITLLIIFTVTVKFNKGTDRAAEK
jgi:hypothetical protein